MIPGEMLLYMGHTLNGQIMLTTYRLFVLYGSSFANIALRMIETVEIKSDVCSLAVLCKDATVETYVQILIRVMQPISNSQLMRRCISAYAR